MAWVRVSRVIISLILFSSVAMAVSRPTIPEAAEDKVLFNGLSAAQFFAGRARDSQCRQTLDEARTNYVRLRGDLQLLVAKIPPGQKLHDGDPLKIEIDAKEATLEEARANELTFMESCGECATRKIEKRDIKPDVGPKEVWYIADGSCFLGNLSSDFLNLGFDRLRSSLVNSRRYPQHNGGFRNLVEFAPYDNQTGTFLENVGVIPAFPIYVA